MRLKNQLLGANKQEIRA